ncbi:MAG: hypothetical protein JWR32_4713 [Mycobacterium sp.]|jgi:hypothetical protein|nr:hypothetical protein [Mycobacterium sp.]
MTRSLVRSFIGPQHYSAVVRLDVEQRLESPASIALAPQLQ